MSLRTGWLNGVGALRRAAGKSACLAGRGVGRLWHLLVRNRLAVALASLVWLVFRSGSQPRRLSYPCQQVAAFNVGAFIAGLCPALFLFKKNRTQPSVPRAIVIRRQLVAAGLLFVGALLSVEGYQFAQNLIPPEIPAVPARQGDPVPATVGIAQRDLYHPDGETFTLEEIEALVRKAVERAGGLGDVITAGDWVVLKPNLVQSFWDGSQGVVTDPRVCAAVAKLAWEAGAGQVSIAEGTADGAGRNSTWVAYTTAGYDGTDGPSDRLFDYDTNVQLLDLNDAGGKDPNPVQNCQWVTLGDNAALRKAPLGYWVPNTIMNCDVLITVPTFKNHSNGTLTLSLKNRVGCPPNDIYHHPSMDTMKWSLVHSVTQGGPDGHGFPSNVPPTPSHEHEIVQRTLVDLNLVRPQDFAVIDGLIGVTTGPNVEPIDNPDPRMRMIIAGKDSVAVDTVGALAMGYDPEYVPQITWADSTGALGTMDRSVITVIGDRVWKVRYDFPENYASPYGGSVRAESSPPWIFSVPDVSEGDKIVDEDVITGSGLGDNTGVVRAELGIDVLGANLLVNGDFETGDATGWTEWTENSGWGHDEAWDYANTQSGHKGNYCLKLGNSSTESSFGVYQEVAVEPGKTYRLDTFWRGTKLGDANWFEVVLIDGSFSIEQADVADLVEKNYMYAYDNNTYGLPGAIGTTFGWVWGHSQYAPPKDRVDWNNRQGRRVASGDTMTVVLKAGACCGSVGVAAWFDEVRLTEVVSEHVVDSVANPSDPVQLVFDAAPFPPGEHPAELRVTVYDAALNEDSIVRNVTIQTCPLLPWVCLSDTLFERTIFVGESLADDAFDVWNCGCEVAPVNYTVASNAGWLSVYPEGGVSAEGDPPTTHTITYATESLTPGQRTATITITGDNNERTVMVKLNVETVPPDFDLDGDVDMSDFGHLQVCLTGAGIQVQGTCKDADLDGDGDVDHDDFGDLQGCLSGATLPPDRDCMD